MQNQGESEFARTSVLENCAFFTCVQCGYCGYLILGGSAKELRDEEERHAIECKATHGLIGAGSRRAYVQKRRVLLNIVTFWITVISSFLSCAVFTRGRHRNPFNAQS